MRVMKRGESDYNASVEMIAEKHGTVAGEAGIIHTDPKHSEKRHRELLVSENDALLLEKRKLARRVTEEDKKPKKGAARMKEQAQGGDGDEGARLADAGAKRVAGTAGAEESTGGAASSLSTLETTAHRDGAEIRGEGEPATGLDETDPTVPPVPARGGRQAAAPKTGN